MTVKDFLEVCTESVIIADGRSKYPIFKGNKIYAAFSDCLIETISIAGADIEITLKTDFIRK